MATASKTAAGAVSYAAQIKDALVKQPTMREIAAQNGLNVGWNNKTGDVTITDPNTGKSISYNNADTSKFGDYGLGGFQNNANTVSDVNKFLSNFKADTPKTTSTPTAPSYTPAVDNSGLINSQYSNLINSLKAQIQQSINNKNQEINGLPAQYQSQKDASEVAKANDLRMALEQAANAGDRGGIGRQNALNTQAAGENRLNNINLQQEGQKNSLTNDIANLELDKAIQSGQYTAQQIKDLINNNQYVNDTNYNRSQDQFNNNVTLAQLLGTYNGQDTLAKQNQQFNQGISLADLLGTYNGQPTMAKQQMDTQNSQWQQTFDQNTKQQNWQNNFNQQQFDYQKSRDAVADQHWQQELNLNLRQQSFAEAQAKIDNAYRNGQLSLQERSQALDWAKFNADQDPNSLDNQLKKASLDKSSNNSLTYQDYFDYGKTLMPNRSVAYVTSWISGLPLSAQEKANLANALGLAR